MNIRGKYTVMYHLSPLLESSATNSNSTNSRQLFSLHARDAEIPPFCWQAVGPLLMGCEDKLVAYKAYLSIEKTSLFILRNSSYCAFCSEVAWADSSFIFNFYNLQKMKRDLRGCEAVRSICLSRTFRL